MRSSMLVAAGLLAVATPLTTAACQMVTPPTIVWAQSASVVPFDLYRGTRIYAPGTVNGHATPMLLDSGASMTTLDRAYARSIGIKPGMKVAGRGAGGAIEAEIVSDVTLTVGGMRFEKMSVAVIDFGDVAAAIGRPMPVVLGREFFAAAAIGIDWQRNELTLTPAAGFQAPAGATLAPLKARDSFHFIQVSVAGLPPIEALFDLGNGGNLNLPSDYWSKQPALANLRYADSQLGGVGGLHASRIVTFPDVTFAGQRFAGVTGHLGPDSRGNDPAHGSNLGIGMLKPFKVVLDLGNSRIFLTPLADPPAFLRDRSGLRTQRDGDSLKVMFTSPQGPAHAAGIRAGDRITAIDGQKVDAAAHSGAQAEWSRRPAGTKVALTLGNGRTIGFILADFF